MTINNIDTGDHVHHAPSGESWVVAYVQGDRLAWCGWPEGEARLADCTLLEKATPERRQQLLVEMAAMTGRDARQRYAARRLTEEGDAAQQNAPECARTHADAQRGVNVCSSGL